MSRIRYLKPCFFKDEDIAELPHWVRLLYQGLWTIADKAGRLEDRPKRIKAEIFPYEDVDAEAGLKLLSGTKKGSGKAFINRYEVEGERYIEILSWEEHQKPHNTEKESVIPINKYKGNGDGEVGGSKSCNKEPLKDGYLTVNGQDSQYKLFFDAWNLLCGGLPKVSELSNSRKEKIRLRLKERSQEAWELVFKRLSESEFCCGKNDRGWKASFDWIISNDNNSVKVLEGKYDGKLKDSIKEESWSKATTV